MPSKKPSPNLVNLLSSFWSTEGSPIKIAKATEIVMERIMMKVKKFMIKEMIETSKSITK